MAQINFLIWPLVIICPIYPLLLAFVWFQLYRKNRPNQLLLAFATIPSIVFGILALLYYPLAMFYQGFSWNGFGQIFWVLFYALQGWYLLKKYKVTQLALSIASIYLLIKLYLDYRYLSFGYLDFTGFSAHVMGIVIAYGVVAVGMLWILDFRREKE